MNNSKKLSKKFIVLWIGQFIATIGTGLTSFGLGVYVYQLTGKASTTALVALFAFIPSILLGPIAGILADRYDRRLLMIIGDSFSALGPIFILICILFGEIEIWQIYIGVLISSIFSSLLEPSYKATITDLLTEDQYTKASGLVQLAGSARYLISPIIAGFILVVSGIKLLLLIDILTIIITVTTVFAVRKGISPKKHEKKNSFIQEFKDGWSAISSNKGLLILVIVTLLITFFMGAIQTLSTPLVLAFSNAAVFGILETISALGMVVTSLIIGIIAIKNNYLKTLSSSLFFAGIFMILFGFRDNIILMSISGFLFFAMLPFANTSLDYLIRTNIENSLQGRAWGLIGLISQLGYVIAYATSGFFADYVFSPLFLEGGALYNNLGKVIGTGIGRGIGFMIIIAGALLAITSLVLYNIKSVKNLEKEASYVLENNS